MCGLAGDICFGTARSSPEILRHMFVSQEIRGKDSSGVAYEKGGEILAMKRAVPAGTFVGYDITKSIWEDISNSAIALLHARHATKGPAKNNENNHPVLACEWVVTHNGHVSNDDDLIQYYGMEKERPAEVDTVAINMALAQGETVEESLGHVSLLAGTATFLAWNIQRPKELLMARVNGPALYLAFDKSKKILYWSSDTDGLQKVAEPAFGSLKFLPVSVLPQNTAFHFGPGGIKQYSLDVIGFHMPIVPKSTPPKTEEKQQSLVVVGSNLPKSLTTTATTTSGITSPPTSQVSEPGRLPPQGLMGSLATTVNSWLSQVRESNQAGPSLLTKEHQIATNENYIEMGKPAPRFETGMAVWAENPPPEATDFVTPYGTWLLTPNNRWFRGAKRIKAYWQTKISPKIRADVRFPATKDVAESLNGVHKLEIIRIYSGKVEYAIGIMCPWCGIIAKTSTWRNWKYTCGWCNVRSVLKEVVK